MKRWKIPVAAVGLVLLLAWGLYRLGQISRQRAENIQPGQVQSADPMETPAGWRYRQNQPRHWRYIVLQN